MIASKQKKILTISSTESVKLDALQMQQIGHFSFGYIFNCIGLHAISTDKQGKVLTHMFMHYNGNVNDNFYGNSNTSHSKESQESFKKFVEWIEQAKERGEIIETKSYFYQLDSLDRRACSNQRLAFETINNACIESCDNNSISLDKHNAIINYNGEITYTTPTNFFVLLQNMHKISVQDINSQDIVETAQEPVSTTVEVREVDVVSEPNSQNIGKFAKQAKNSDQTHQNIFKNI